jgi:hypothetical protein
MHFGAFSPLPCASRREIVARAASSGLTMHQRTGTLMHRSGKVRGSALPSSSIQNHGTDCPGRGESPLSDTAAF